MKGAGKVKRPPNQFLLWMKKYRPFINKQLSNKTFEQKKIFLSYLIPNQNLLLNAIGDWSILNAKINNAKMSKILGVMWKYYVSPEEKNIYKQEQERIKKIHKEQNPGYIYTPNKFSLKTKESKQIKLVNKQPNNSQIVLPVKSQSAQQSAPQSAPQIPPQSAPQSAPQSNTFVMN